jgi:hypothetical protein
VTTVTNFVAAAETYCAPVSDDPLTVPANAVCGCRTPTESGPAKCARPDEELSRLLDHDSTDHLVSYLKRLTDLATTALPAAQRAYLRYVWPSVDSDGNLVAREVMYRYGARAPRPDTLPGILTRTNIPVTDRDYYDVLVTFDRLGSTPNDELPTLETLYALKTRNAPESYVTPFGRVSVYAATAAAEGLSFFRTKGGKPLDVGPKGSPSMPRVVLKIYAPTIPQRRAEISVHDLIFTPPTPNRLKDASQDLADDLTSSVGRVSLCAAGLAGAYAEAIANASGDSPTHTIFSAQASIFRDRLNDVLDEAHEAILKDPAMCPKDSGFTGSDPVSKVDEAFRDLVKGLGTNVASDDIELQNQPREHVSFGFLAAARFGNAHYEAVRARVADDGTLTEDPLPRLLSAVVVNWHPYGFRNEITSFGDRGSLKLFTGAAVAPDFGLVAGIAYSPLRGLAANLGYSVMWVNAPREGVVLHEPVPEQFRNDPLRSALAGTGFWGLSYSVQ